MNDRTSHEHGRRMMQGLYWWGLPRLFGGLSIVGGDVACLIPTKDNPNQITSLVATSILFEMVCLKADGMAGEAEAP